MPQFEYIDMGKWEYLFPSWKCDLMPNFCQCFPETTSTLNNPVIVQFYDLTKEMLKKRKCGASCKLGWLKLVPAHCWEIGLDDL